MALFSSDPAVAKKQMLTVVFLLTAFGHMDGKFALSEKRFVQEKIAKLVEERMLEATMDPLARRVAIERATQQFQRVAAKIDREIAALYTESVAGLSRYSAPIAKLGRLRSAGITDLRHGYVIDEHWVGRDRFDKHKGERSDIPLPANVACFALAGGADVMVPVESALAGFPKTNVATAEGVSHLELLDERVYPILREWLQGPVTSCGAGSPIRSS